MVAADLAGGDDAGDTLRALGRTAHAGEGSVTAAGRREFARIVAALATVKPPLPVALGDDDALARLLWWCSACLGFTRSQLVKVVSGTGGAVVQDGAARPPSADRLDRLMWRSGPPPVRGTAARGLERIVQALDAARTPPAPADIRDVWRPLAFERARLIEPGTAALVAMLAHLADEPVDLRRMGEHSVRLSPVALARSFETPVSLRRAVDVGRRLGLLDGMPGRCALSSGTRAQIIDALTPAERRFGAQAAIAAMATVYPPETYRAATWDLAAALREHAYAAARHSEEQDVGEAWRADVLERLCIFDYEHGRAAEAAEAGERALRAAEQHRVDDEKLSDILVNYAKALSQLRRWQEAEACFLRAAALDRRDEERAKTLNIYASSLREAGRLDEAIQRHQEALQLAGESTAPVTRAQILHDESLAFSRKRQYDDALEALREAERLVPLNTEEGLLIQTRTAVTLNEMDQHHDALAVIDPVMPNVRKTWGKLSWPYVNAWHARGVAIDALAQASGDPRAIKAAEAEYLRYRALRDQLEADPEHAPGAVTDV